MFKLVYVGPKEFKHLVYRLLVTGIIILISFNFGSWFYLYTASKFHSQAKLRVFADILQASTNKDLELIIDGTAGRIGSKELKAWIEPYNRSYSNKKDLRFSDKFSDYLKSLAAEINSEPVDAKFEFEGNKAKVFSNSIPGKKLNLEKSASGVMKTLLEGRASVALVVNEIEPTITLEKVNDLGIKTLVAKGESNFKGSSSARIHNIQTGASKFNGTIIKPGEEFSFNKILGKVDEKSGYQYELVIKEGELIPEYGGGLCQVSTTFFRAAIFAGFPILERRPHSFPVKYYNPQGFDSTIYPGVSDLRFVNDTESHILIQTKINGSKLIVELYGSDEGRQVILDGPHQYDQKSSGAMKAYFVRKISYGNGETKEERFDSNYKPPVPHARNPLE